MITIRRSQEAEVQEKVKIREKIQTKQRTQAPNPQTPKPITHQE